VTKVLNETTASDRVSRYWEESEEEQVAETGESEGRDEEEEESAGREKEVGLKSRKRSGAGGVGGEEKLRCQEEEEGTKRRRRIGVRGGPVEGEREEGGKTTFALHELIMQRLIARIYQIPHVDHNDPTGTLPSFLT